MSLIKNRYLLLTLTAALAACSSLPAARNPVLGTDAPLGELRISRVLISEGLQKLRQSRFEDASRVFNAGLKFAPENAQMHYLNGLAYHLLYLRGDDAAKDLAAMGYEMALSIEPAHYPAALQLGRLEYEAKRYPKSVDAYRLATDIQPRSGEAYMGLAMAAYYARDLVMAHSAMKNSVSLLRDNAAVTRVEAMIYAGLGDQASAKQAAARYAVLDTDADANMQLDQRVDQWDAWHTMLRILGADDVSRPIQEPPRLLAQLGSPVYTNPTPSAAYSYSPPVNAVRSPPSQHPVIPRWFDCDTASVTSSSTSGYASAYGGSSSNSSSGSVDETTPLPALPAPCKDAGNPRMAILDVAIVRSEDTASSSNGVNLLSGLTYVFSRSHQIVDLLTRTSSAPDSRTVTITQQRNNSLSNPANPAGIAYSLNIANATNARSEVLAQPSLVALDRQPSTFFSGRNITLGIAGQAGGSSTFTDKPVGVSLSVTPTFVDDDTMLVAVHAARSFVEQIDPNVSFGQTMQTSRNSVSSNVVLKFGQTLILSGLAEQEVQRTSDGVPVLQDIPVLQYMFRNKTTQNFTRSVLVLITPRKPDMESQQLARLLPSLSHGADADKEAVIRKLSTRPINSNDINPNLDSAYKHALESKLFLQFRVGDMRADDWSTPSRLDSLFRQILSSIYF